MFSCHWFLSRYHVPYTTNFASSQYMVVCRSNISAKFKDLNIRPFCLFFVLVSDLISLAFIHIFTEQVSTPTLNYDDGRETRETLILPLAHGHTMTPGATESAWCYHCGRCHSHDLTLAQRSEDVHWLQPSSVHQGPPGQHPSVMLLHTVVLHNVHLTAQHIFNKYTHNDFNGHLKDASWLASYFIEGFKHTFTGQNLPDGQKCWRNGGIINSVGMRVIFFISRVL